MFSIMDEFMQHRAEQYTDCYYLMGKKPVGGNPSKFDQELDNGVTEYTYWLRAGGYAGVKINISLQ